MLMIHGRRSAE